MSVGSIEKSNKEKLEENAEFLVSICRYVLRWDKEDQIYIVKVEEFPSLSVHSETSSAAFEGMRKLLNEVIIDMLETGEPLPERLQSAISWKYGNP